MADVPIPAPEFYSIVVVGKMNPAIHHPTWYKYLGLLDEQECNSALAATIVVVSPVSQFTAPPFQVVCQPERWEIQTTQSKYMERILVTASKVFEVLTHTPVSAYGFNFHFHKEARTANVGQALGSAVSGLPLGLVLSEDEAGEMSVISTNKDGHTTITVAQSALGPNRVLVRFNAHYNIALALNPVHFELTPLLREHFFPDHARAEQYAQSVVSGLPKLGGVNGGRNQRA